MKSDDRLLFGLDTPVVIDCIKSAIDSVIDTKIQDINALFDENAAKKLQEPSTRSSVSCPEVFEQMIQELEASVRNHIRTEQMLKVYIEGMEERVAEYESEIRSFDSYLSQLKEKYTNVANENESMKQKNS